MEHLNRIELFKPKVKNFNNVDAFNKIVTFITFHPFNYTITMIDI
jgi:hypothetical protein